MLLNITTGYGGVRKRQNEEIIILIGSLSNLAKSGRRVLFTDRQALMAAAQFFDDLNFLQNIDWKILQASDFKGDPNDPGKRERYMAEALVQKHVSVQDLLGIACFDSQTQQLVTQMAAGTSLAGKVYKKSTWYF